MRMQKVCQHCTATFLRPSRLSQGQWQDRKYCSPSCRAQARQLANQRCPGCGTDFHPRTSGQQHCSKACWYKMFRAPEVPCQVCGILFHARHGNKRQQCCSQACRNRRMSQTRKGKRPDAALHALALPAAQAKLQAYLHSPRNPLLTLSSRRKAQDRLAAQGYGHFFHGGNQPLTTPQQLLANRLGWPTEVTVRLNTLPGRARSRRERATRPYRYCLDLAEETLKIAVEVDGQSHGSRRNHDQCRDAKLCALGWTVLRFTNRQVLTDLESVLAQIAAVVQSITSTQRPGTISPIPS